METLHFIFKWFYNEFSLAAEKLFLGFPTTQSYFKDLYPIFAFDITDQATILKSDSSIRLTVTGSRTLLEPAEVEIYICGFVRTRIDVDFNKVIVKSADVDK